MARRRTPGSSPESAGGERTGPVLAGRSHRAGPGRRRARVEDRPGRQLVDGMDVGHRTCDVPFAPSSGSVGRHRREPCIVSHRVSARPPKRRSGQASAGWSPASFPGQAANISKGTCWRCWVIPYIGQRQMPHDRRAQRRKLSRCTHSVQHLCRTGCMQNLSANNQHESTDHMDGRLSDDEIDLTSTNRGHQLAESCLHDWTGWDDIGRGRYRRACPVCGVFQQRFTQPESFRAMKRPQPTGILAEWAG